MMNFVNSFIKKRNMQETVRPVKHEIFHVNRKQNLTDKFKPSQTYAEGIDSRSNLGVKNLTVKYNPIGPKIIAFNPF
jgi:hypothetical protein